MRRWPLFLLATPVMLWSAYWGAAAFALKHGTDTLLRSQLPQHLNGQVSHTEVRGYPTRFQLHLSDVALHNEGTFSWTSPSLQVEAPSYSPQTVNIEIASPQHIRSRWGDLELTTADSRITVLVRPALALPLATAQVVLDQALIAHAAGWQVRLEHLMIALEDTASPGTYDMRIGVTALDLSDLLPELPPSHRILPAIFASVELGFARDWDRTLMEAGTPDLRRATIQEAGFAIGSSQITISGYLDVTENNTLSGQLALNVTAWRELISVLRQVRYLDPDVADLITEFLADQNASDQIVIPLELRDGRVQFGIFTLGVLPALP